MSESQHYGNLKLVKEYQFKAILDDIISTSQEDLDKRDYGYYFEVDLNYPRKLHNKHKDLPYGAEKEIPNQELFGGYQQHFFSSSNEFKYIPTTKLLTTLFDKEKYVLHQRNLKQFIEAGLQVKKVHRALKFSQSHWLGQYIDYNTRMRTKANNDFEKDFYKLMNNSVFGKTMENIRNRQNVRLATTWEQVEKLINKPSFKRVEIFTDNFCAVHLNKESIKMDKPIYVGTSVLDLSKYLMYDYFYNNLKKRYGENIVLLCMDTYSFILEITTDDVYKDMKEDEDLYDASNYDPNNPLFSNKNKKVVGKFKDELGEKILP